MKDQTVTLEIERSRLSREKSVMVFDKAILLYFSFLIIGVVGFVNSYVNRTTFYVLVSMSLLILVVGLIPYIITMLREEKRLNQLINSHARKREGGKR